jgi:hypothetical protein
MSIATRERSPSNAIILLICLQSFYILPHLTNVLKALVYVDLNICKVLSKCISEQISYDMSHCTLFLY